MFGQIVDKVYSISNYFFFTSKHILWELQNGTAKLCTINESRDMISNIKKINFFEFTYFVKKQAWKVNQALTAWMSIEYIVSLRKMNLS